MPNAPLFVSVPSRRSNSVFPTLNVPLGFTMNVPSLVTSVMNWPTLTSPLTVNVPPTAFTTEPEPYIA